MPDDEINALAAAIAGETQPEAALSKPGEAKGASATSQETVEPASQEEQKSIGQSEEQEGEEVEADGEVKADPLRGLTLRELLEHPELGPTLQEWADGAAVAQVRAALERERPSIAASEQQKARERAEDEHFAALDEDDLRDELARNPKAAAAYARYQARKEASELSSESVEQAAQTYAYAAQIKTYNQLLEESGLPADVKTALDPKNFTYLGTEGIVAWGKAIYDALVLHGAQAQSTKLLEDRWETYKQEQLAELDGERPLAMGGRKTVSVPDLMGTDTGVLFEHALSQKEKK